jgi:hypothetical protein
MTSVKLAPIALLLLAGSTAGCATANVARPPASHPPPSTAELTRHVPCFDGHQRLVGPNAVRRFHAVAAVSCVDGERIYPGRGQWDVHVRRIAGGDVAALQRYFERPSRHDLPKGHVCLLVARFILTPMLVDAQGHWLAPRTPVDACGTPLGKLPNVRWHVVSVRRLKLQTSAAALASHCAMSVKDVPAGAIGPLQPSSGGSLFAHPPRTVDVCVFRTSGACANQRLFAVVGARNDPTEEGVWGELGGCFRVAGFRGSYVLGSANASVVHAILGG